MKKKNAERNNDRERKPICVDVIIETPGNNRNKFKYDPETKIIKLSKVMPEGMHFPYDFGFVPSTKAEDGDPVDVLVLTDAPLFPGCAVECRLIGVVEAEQEQQGKRNRNDRLIAVATQSIRYSDIYSLHDLAPSVIRQIEEFFVNYQRVRSVTVTILGRGGPTASMKILEKASMQKPAA
jgi:inorganic pyrophosphatase